MKSTAQPLLPLPAVRPEGPPLVLRMAVDRNGFAVQVGAHSNDPAQWDKNFPRCAPHYIANFQEVLP